MFQDLKRLEKSNLNNNKEYQDDHKNRNYAKLSEQNIKFVFCSIMYKYFLPNELFFILFSSDQVGPKNREKNFPREFENNGHYENGFQKSNEYDNPHSMKMQEFDHENGKNIYNYELQSKYIPVENTNRKNYYMGDANRENSIKKYQNEREYENENYGTDNHEHIYSNEPVNQPSPHSCCSQPEGIDYEDGNEYFENLSKINSDIESLESIANRHINQNLQS